jgi:hypothetical protein
MHYLEGKKVDPSGELPDGRKFAGIDELKTLLLKEEPKIARALAVKLVTFATGGPPEEIDRPEVDAIMKARGRGGVRSLVHAVIQSKLFREK